MTDVQIYQVLCLLACSSCMVRLLGAVEFHTKCNHTYIYVLVDTCLTYVRCLCSVVVITCASHAQGPQFDPGQRHTPFLFNF